MASCLLFDGNRANATLIGIEYVISNSLLFGDGGYQISSAKPINDKEIVL
jgi:hypothetical protein